ncbi:MAG TPA: hypothetical protein VIS07_00445 [Candidatus Binatia bacterium]
MRKPTGGDLWALVVGGVIPAGRRVGSARRRPVDSGKRRGRDGALAATVSRLLPLAGPARTAVAVLDAAPSSDAELARLPVRNVFVARPGAAQPLSEWSALLRIHALDRSARVAMLPADGRFADDEALRAHLRMAGWVVRRHPNLVVMLGVRPRHPAAGCRYVDLGAPAPDCAFAPVFTVRGYCEPSGDEAARYFAARGALCAPPVVVARVARLLELMEDIASEEADRWAHSVERARAQGVGFRSVLDVSVARLVLERARKQVVVLRADGLEWREGAARSSVRTSTRTPAAPWHLPRATA